MPCPIDQLQAQNIKQGQAYYTLTLQVEGGAFKAPPEQKWQFQHFLLFQLSPKNLTFPINLLGCLPYPFGGSKHPKKGFL